MRENKRFIVATIVCILLAIGTALYPPVLLERAVNLLGRKQAIPIGLALLYLFSIVLANVFDSIQDVCITTLGQRLTRLLRYRMVKKLNVLPASYFTAHPQGEIASLFVNDGDTMNVLYSDGILGLLADSLKLVGLLYMIATRSMGLFFLLLLVLPFLYWFTRRVQKGTLQAELDNREAIARMNHHIPETLRVMRMIRVFQKEKYMEKRYDDICREAYRAISRSNFYDSVYSPVVLIVQAIVIGALMIGASMHSEWFGITVGSAVAIVAYVGQLFAPLESLGMEIESIQSALAGIKRIQSFMKEAEYHFPIHPSPTLVFDHVWFGYDQSYQIQDLSFSVQPGEHVTFVGPTGVGKSTIFRLILGLYTPQKGQIASPCFVENEKKRQTVGVVFQEFEPVAGTLADQIRLYDVTITDDQIRHTLQQLGLSDAKLNQPFDVLDWSEGQLQLLGIARAIVCDPDVLMLDEMSAHLDVKTEKYIFDVLEKVSQDKMVLSISHRYCPLYQRVIEIGV